MTRDPVLEVLAEAWAQSPARVIAVLAATPFIVLVAWLWLVVFLVAFGGPAA